MRGCVTGHSCGADRGLGQAIEASRQSVRRVRPGFACSSLRVRLGGDVDALTLRGGPNLLYDIMLASQRARGQPALPSDPQVEESRHR